jgi:predicted O-methyltransferase YrrM
MKFDDVAAVLDGIPYMSPRKGRVFYDFVMETKPEECLELGFAHGVSSCYIAAALHERGRGHLTAVDLESGRGIQPSIEELLRRTGLTEWVTPVRELSGHNWFLKKKIEAQSKDGACVPLYDFCFIDAAKNWTLEGYAFFLVDKLLRQGGWVVFDDYGWSYAEHGAATGKKATAGINHQELSDDELRAPHIEAVFRTLVMQHPDYSNFRVVDEQVAFAQKVRGEVKAFRLESSASVRYKLVKAFRALRRRGR